MLRGIDVRGSLGGFGGSTDLHIDLIYDGETGPPLDWDDVVTLSEAAGADFDAQFDYLDFVKRLLAAWPDIMALLVKLGFIGPGASRIGDGKLLELIGLLTEYVPQIIDLLVKLGILKPKGGVGASEFGDGQILKKLFELFIKILPLLLMLLKNEKPTDIGNEP